MAFKGKEIFVDLSGVQMHYIAFFFFFFFFCLFSLYSPQDNMSIFFGI